LSELRPDIHVVPAVAPGIASLRRALEFNPVSGTPGHKPPLFGPKGAAEEQAIADLWGHVHRGRLAARTNGWALDPVWTEIYLLAVVPRASIAPPVMAMTRAAMARLDASAGGLGPWLAAIHETPDSSHAHVVLAATREREQRHIPLFIHRAQILEMQDAAHAEWVRHQELVQRRDGRTWGR
jgi:hypothetical protein